MGDRIAEKPVITSTNRARAGITGQHVRHILVLSTALVAVIFAGLWLFYFA